MAASSAKLVANDETTGYQVEVVPTVVSLGASSAGQAVGLNSSGQIDVSVLPPRVGADTQAMPASEALAAGALVNIWSNAGVFNARNADNTAAGKPAMGYVLAAVAMSAMATVYLSGENNQLTGLIPGLVFLGAAGAVIQASGLPLSTGKVLQRVGMATSATTLQFDFQVPCTQA